MYIPYNTERERVREKESLKRGYRKQQTNNTTQNKTNTRNQEAHQLNMEHTGTSDQNSKNIFSASCRFILFQHHH